LAGPREAGVLGEKAVAGVYRFGLEHRRSGQDELAVQVTLRRTCGADADGVIREAYREAVAVGLGIDLDGLETQFVARAMDPHSDLAAIGDQHPPERPDCVIVVSHRCRAAGCSRFMRSD